MHTGAQVVAPFDDDDDDRPRSRRDDPWLRAIATLVTGMIAASVASSALGWLLGQIEGGLI